MWSSMTSWITYEIVKLAGDHTQTDIIFVFFCIYPRTSKVENFVSRFLYNLDVRTNLCKIFLTRTYNLIKWMNVSTAGSWIHSGYHLTTSIVAPALLSLPYAFASLGWASGIMCLVVGAVVTFYSYNLISLVLEHHAELGHRHLRFRDMAHDILGTYLHPLKVNSI